MIIKSMSRKDCSFGQLVAYMEKDAGERAVFHNLYGNGRTARDEIVREFEENASFLPKRANGNVLYHEIVSLSAGHGLDREAAARVLGDIGHEYLARRAPGQIAYGVMHKDTDHLHLHLCISANAIGSGKRERLSKKDFARVQKEVEELVRTRYPEIRQEAVYARGRHPEAVKTTAREQAMAGRTGKASRKAEIAARAHAALALAGSERELSALLASEGLVLSKRGKNWTLEATDGSRYRLSTLGLALHHSAALERFGSPDAQPEKRRRERDGNGAGRRERFPGNGREGDVPLPGAADEEELRRRREETARAVERGRNAPPGRERTPWDDGLNR